MESQGKHLSQKVLLAYAFIILSMLGFFYWGLIDARTTPSLGDNPLAGLGEGIAVMGMLLASSINAMVFVWSLNQKILYRIILLIFIAVLPWFGLFFFFLPFAAEGLFILNLGILWRLSKTYSRQSLVSLALSPVFLILTIAGLVLTPEISYHWSRRSVSKPVVTADLTSFAELSAEDMEMLFQTLSNRKDWEVNNLSALRLEPNIDPQSYIFGVASHYPCCKRVLNTRVAMHPAPQQDRACHIDDSSLRVVTSGSLRETHHQLHVRKGRIADTTVYESCLLLKNSALGIGIFDTSSEKERKFTQRALNDLQKLSQELEF